MNSVMQLLHRAAQMTHPALQWLQAQWYALLASPHRWTIFAAAAVVALLLISIPLLRAGSRRSDENAMPHSYSMLGIGSLPAAEEDADRSMPRYPRWADASLLNESKPEIAAESTPAPIVVPVSGEPISAAPISNVTPIHPSMTVECTHCGAALSARQDFCPACGYAQPAQEKVAAFPA